MRSVCFQRAALKITAGLAKQFPADGLPQIAFSGRSNVGKSSLINTLLDRKSLARVSGTPGKTITINFYDVDHAFYFVDLPGYGYAARSPEDKKRWSTLTNGYFAENPNIDLLRLVIQLVDSRIGPTEDDLMMLEFLRSSGLPHLIVATKEDKLNKTEREARMASLSADFPDIPALLFSSLKGTGKEELRRLILQSLTR